MGKIFFERVSEIQERFSIVKNINEPFIFSRLEGKIEQIEVKYDNENIKNKYLFHINIGNLLA